MSIFVDHAFLKHKHKDLKGIGKDDHHRAFNWADEQGWIRVLRLPFSREDDWTRSPANPVLNVGFFPDWDQHGVQSPAMIITDRNYLFYSNIKAAHDMTPTAIGIAYCNKGDMDGPFRRYTGNPIVTTGSGKNREIGRGLSPIWDEIDQRWKLWYHTRDSVAGRRIFYAYRDDPDPLGAWVDYGAVYDPTYTLAAGCGVLRFGNLYYMLTTRTAAEGGGLRVATSPDGLSWTDWGEVLNVTVGEWDATWVAYASVFWNLGVWYIVYTGWDGTSQRIGLATSYSGFRTFDKWPFNPTFHEAGGSAWDGARVLQGSFLQYEDTFYMYYCGEHPAGENRKIGLATIP